ncbi:MAG: hypothetical protein KAI64_04455, partial [Thermoplasmata archaeon]|nr:hypothetical protein [Thermoplasmata archaeon]
DADRIRIGFEASMRTHAAKKMAVREGEVRESSSKINLNSAVQNYDDHLTNLVIFERELRDREEFAKDNNIADEVMQAGFAEWESKVHRGRILLYLSNRRYFEAEEFFETVKGELNPTDLLEMTKAVRSGAVTGNVRLKTDEIRDLNLTEGESKKKADEIKDDEIKQGVFRAIKTEFREDRRIEEQEDDDLLDLWKPEMGKPENRFLQPSDYLPGWDAASDNMKLLANQLAAENPPHDPEIYDDMEEIIRNNPREIVEKGRAEFERLYLSKFDKFHRAQADSLYKMIFKSEFLNKPEARLQLSEFQTWKEEQDDAFFKATEIERFDPPTTTDLKQELFERKRWFKMRVQQSNNDWETNQDGVVFRKADRSIKREKIEETIAELNKKTVTVDRSFLIGDKVVKLIDLLPWQKKHAYVLIADVLNKDPESARKIRNAVVSRKPELRGDEDAIVDKIQRIYAAQQLSDEALEESILNE